MAQFDDPCDMAPAELLQEVAGLLATGFLHLETRTLRETNDAPVNVEIQSTPPIPNSRCERN